MNVEAVRKHLTEEFTHRVLSLQLGSLDYIQKLASVSGTNIIHWDLTPLMEDGKFPVDRNKINQLFFDQIDEQKAKAMAASAEASKNFSATDRTFLKELFQNSPIENLRSRLDRSRRDYQRQVNVMFDHQKAIIARKKEVEDALKGDTDDIGVKIEAVISDGFWEFEGIIKHPERGDMTGVEFQTVNDVIITHIVAEHGVKKQVNFGKFKLHLDKDLRANVTKIGFHERNWPADTSEFKFPYISNRGGLSAGGYIHPHLSGTEMCLGSMGGDYSTARAQKDIRTVCSVIQKVLLSYNDDDSYVHINDFEASLIALKEGKDIYRVGNSGIQNWTDMINSASTNCENCGEVDISQCDCWDPAEPDPTDVVNPSSGFRLRRRVGHSTGNGTLTFEYSFDGTDWNQYYFSDAYTYRHTGDDLNGSYFTAEDRTLITVFVREFLIVNNFPINVADGRYRAYERTIPSVDQFVFTEFNIDEHRGEIFGGSQPVQPPMPPDGPERERAPYQTTAPTVTVEAGTHAADALVYAHVGHEHGLTWDRAVLADTSGDAIDLDVRSTTEMTAEVNPVDIEQMRAAQQRLADVRARDPVVFSETAQNVGRAIDRDLAREAIESNGGDSYE